MQALRSLTSNEVTESKDGKNPPLFSNVVSSAFHIRKQNNNWDVQGFTSEDKYVLALQPALRMVLFYLKNRPCPQLLYLPRNFAVNLKLLQKNRVC